MGNQKLENAQPNVPLPGSTEFLNSLVSQFLPWPAALDLPDELLGLRSKGRLEPGGFPELPDGIRSPAHLGIGEAEVGAVLGAPRLMLDDFLPDGKRPVPLSPLGQGLGVARLGAGVGAKAKLLGLILPAGQDEDGDEVCPGLGVGRVELVGAARSGYPIGEVLAVIDMPGGA